MLDQRGSASVEFAAVGGLFIAMLFACIDVGRYYMTQHSLRETVGTTIRSAIVNEDLDGCDAPKEAVAGKFVLLDETRLELCVERTAGSGSQSITVNASYPFAVSAYAWLISSATLRESVSVTLPDM